MATRMEETIGFPAILNEMMRCARYAFLPEYAVYARGYGVGLVDYVATLHLGPRMVIGPPPPDFEAWGTSMEMAIQGVAQSAIVVLRHEHPELWEEPFTYLPCGHVRIRLPMLLRLRMGLSPWRDAWLRP